MALPLPVNCTFDLYRHYDGAHLYPPADNPRYAGLEGHLRHHVKNGRFGYQALNLHWTHVLHVATTTDIRSAYDSQLDPARNNGRADVVLVKDYPLPGWCTTFFVVLIVRKDRGSATDHFMCYLDRFGPQTPCFPAPPPCSECPACPDVTPDQFTFTVDTTYRDGVVFADGLTRAARWNGCWTLSKTGQCQWTYVGDSFRFVLTNSPTWQLQLYDDPVAGCSAIYFAPLNAFDCATPTLFGSPSFPNTGGCGSGPSFPAQILVQRAPNTSFCGCCPGLDKTAPLHATITQADDPACACLVGLTWPLTWNTATGRWESASQPVCGGGGIRYLDFYLECLPGGTDVTYFRLSAGNSVPNCTTDFVAPQPNSRCTPLNLRFRVQQNGGCCGSSTSRFTVVVTS